VSKKALKNDPFKKAQYLIQRGENESLKLLLLSCESPRQLKLKKNNRNQKNTGSERGEREY